MKMGRMKTLKGRLPLALNVQVNLCHHGTVWHDGRHSVLFPWMMWWVLFGGGINLGSAVLYFIHLALPFFAITRSVP